MVSIEERERVECIAGLQASNIHIGSDLGLVDFTWRHIKYCSVVVVCGLLQVESCGNSYSPEER